MLTNFGRTPSGRFELTEAVCRYLRWGRVDRQRSPRARHPVDPQDLADELSERRSRALEEPLDLRLRQREPFPLVEVRNPLHGTTYLVMRPTFPDRVPALCTCTDFARRGLGTCKHIEAADRWLTNHPNAPVPPAAKGTGRSPSAVWQEIDRRLTRERKGSRPESVRLREAGAALIEGPA